MDDEGKVPAVEASDLAAGSNDGQPDARAVDTVNSSTLRKEPDATKKPRLESGNTEDNGSTTNTREGQDMGAERNRGDGRSSAYDDSSSSSEQCTALWTQLDSSLGALLEAITLTVSAVSDTDGSLEGANFARLHNLAMTAHRSLAKIAGIFEMGLHPSGGNADAERTRFAMGKGGERRERLRGIGRKLWMAVRSNPSIFSDQVVAARDGKAVAGSPDDQGHRAAASGYVRALAARFILIDHIRTLESQLKESRNELLAAALSNATGSELEFGIKSFGRAGSAILKHGSDPRSAFHTLALATGCWEGLNVKALEMHGKTEEAASAAALSQKNLEETFDVLALLPDAASLIGCKNGSDQGAEELPTGKIIGSQGNEDVGISASSGEFDVLAQLKNLDSFVSKHCCKTISECNKLEDQSNCNSGRNVPLSTIQRYLPSLARIAYKHGNRFARLGEHGKSKDCLHIAVLATDRCLGHIRQGGTESSRPEIGQALQIQEREMLVVSRECFYVLSHVLQATGEKNTAQKCLDRIEKYIDEQRDRDDKVYAETMKNLGIGESADFRAGSTSDLALEGPKRQDKADITARAQTARAVARHLEAKERAHLAFSRIMLHHHTSPAPSSEDETNIDEQIKVLVELSVKIVGSSRVGPKQSDAIVLPCGGKRMKTEPKSERDVFDLALISARLTKVRRLTINVYENVTDPYEILTQKCGDSKRLCIKLDHLNAILTAVQALREKAKSSSHLDELALEVANGFISDLQAQKAKSTSSDSTLFAASDSSKDWHTILYESRKQIARALSLYRSSDCSYGTVVTWCDLLAAILKLLQKEDITSSSAKDLFSSKYDPKKVLSEVMAIKAHALSMTGNHAYALKTARNAWSTTESSDPCSPNLHNLVVLFHCCVHHEAQNAESSGDALLELDSCLSSVSSSDPTALSDSMTFELMSAFQAFSNTCVEAKGDSGNDLLRGVQERWVIFFAKARPVLQELLQPRETPSERARGIPSLFCILRSYLSNSEHLLVRAVEDKQRIIQIGEGIDRAVEAVLSLLCEGVRGRTLKRTGSKGKRKNKHKDRDVANRPAAQDDGSESNYNLIWDDERTKQLIGQHIDVVWCAEELWNIACQLMQVDADTSTTAEARWIAAQLFAKAHDFALLSEEEDGMKLSEGHLDTDRKSFESLNDVPLSFSLHKGESEASELSSEFSSQCLLLACGNAVDNIRTENGCHSEHDTRMRTSLARIIKAKEEFAMNIDIDDSEQVHYIEGLLAWLALRCMVEIGDDASCAKALEGGLMDNIHISDRNMRGNTDRDPENGTNEAKSHLAPPSSTETDGCVTSTLNKIILVANRAEEQGMLMTTKLLLRFCAHSFLDGLNTGENPSEPTIYSLGELQRKLIEMSLSVAEVVETFVRVDISMKDLDKGSAKKYYTTDELDYFVIEAYNRGIQLIELCDMASAEKLLAISLNLLPACGAEVESHGAEIRSAYGRAVERKGMAGMAGYVSSSSSALIGLLNP